MIDIDVNACLVQMLNAGWVLSSVSLRNGRFNAKATCNGQTVGATSTVDMLDCFANLHAAWQMQEYQPMRLDLCAVCHERIAGYKDERRQVGPVWVCHQCYEDIDVNSR